VVTGAAGGIGTAAIAELRRSGAQVVGLDLAGADVVCDVRDQASVDAAVASAITAFIRTRNHERSTAAGVPLEGAVPVEHVSDAARVLARAALGPPVRDLATSRNGAIGYALARLLPRGVLDRMTLARMRRLSQRGHFAREGLAGEYAERIGRRKGKQQASRKGEW
jgi:hypothetical protein